MAAQTHMMLTPRAGLTPSQRNCFDAIERHITLHRCAPTYEELRRVLGLSSKGPVAQLIAQLKERGYVTTLPYKERSIEIVTPPQDGPAWALPPAIDALLRAHCTRTGDKPEDIIADAVALFLDQTEADAA